MQEKTKSEDQVLLDRRTAAAALSVSLRTVDYLIADGKLRVRRIGRRVLIPRAEIARFAHGISSVQGAAA